MYAKRNFAPASDTGVARRTILIVEDEILIRMAAAEHLRVAGYSVLEATDAAEAVRLIAADRSIELVFSDVHMPGEMDGNGLRSWILKERPYIKVLLTSGTIRRRRATAPAGGMSSPSPTILSSSNAGSGAPGSVALPTR